MEDVCKNIDLSKPKHNDDMAIIVLQSLEVRIYLETIFFMYNISVRLETICNAH